MVLDCIQSVYERREEFYRVRIVIKFSLLSLSHISPLYIFISAFVVDFLAFIMEYRISHTQSMFPKLFITTNLLTQLNLGLLVLLPEKLIVLFTIVFILFIVLIIEVYVHYNMYKQLKQGWKPSNEVEEQESQPENIWNIDLERNQMNENHVKRSSVKRNRFKK